MRRGLRRLAGGVTALSSAVFVVGLVAAAASDGAGRERLAPAITFSLVGMALGTLVMVIHVNSRADINDEERARWRAGLLRGGPFAAAYYLLRR